MSDANKCYRKTEQDKECGHVIHHGFPGLFQDTRQNCHHPSPSVTGVRNSNMTCFGHVNVLDAISRQIREEPVNGLSLYQYSRWGLCYQADPRVKDNVEQTSQVTCNGGIPSVRNKPYHFRSLIFRTCLLLQHNLVYSGLVENTVSRKRGVPFYRVVRRPF